MRKNMNELINTINKTPIEIALGIDADGYTTSKKLYEFLELNPSHYSRWCNRNIVNNVFAEEGVDYFIENSPAGRATVGRGNTVDYKLSSNFAKELSVLADNPRGILARNYFRNCEIALKKSVSKLEEENKGIIKIGRTHLQDATPLYFSQELSGYRSMIEHSKNQILNSLNYVYELACGATAVGSGINCPKGFDEIICSILQEHTNIPFRPDPNKFHALTSKDACVFVSGALKALAANCMKIANDTRWLASGPRCGIHEIDIPANEPGSSIMPGKVNPTQCEALTMVAVQVMGNDTAIGIAASQGNFELNVFMPLIAYNMDQSIQLLSDAIHSFNEHCLSGLKANQTEMEKNLHNSLMLVTCLNPVIGYEKAGKASQYAYKNDLTLKQAILELGYLSEEEFDLYVDPKKMINE